VQFIQHHEAQVLEKSRPSGVVREDAGVQHIGVTENDTGVGANGWTGVGGSVAIINASGQRRVVDNL